MFDCPLAPVRPALVDWITDMACTHAVTLNTDRELSEARLRQIYSTFCLNLDRKILGRRSVTKMNAALRLRGLAREQSPDKASASITVTRLPSAMVTASVTGTPAPGPSNCASRSCARAATSPAFWNRAGWPRRR